MFSNPFFDGFDSDPYYYQPAYQHPSRRRYLQQMRAAEEAKRRRAEAEQREADARQEYLRQLQEEEAYRQAYEGAKRRREKEEARRVQEYLYGNSEYGGDSSSSSDSSESEEDEEEVEMEPIYRVMQGPYGQLYKVKVGEKHRSQPQRGRQSTKRSQQKPSATQKQQQSSNDKNYRLIRGPDGRVYRVQVEQEPTKSEETTKRPAGPSWFPRANDDEEPVEKEDDDEASYASMRIPIRKSFSSGQRKRSSGKKRKQKVTVVVEDASDSESEDKYYKSSWRNRRPSPGQWMEPVNTTAWAPIEIV